MEKTLAAFFVAASAGSPISAASTVVPIAAANCWPAASASHDIRCCSMMTRILMAFSQHARFESQFLDKLGGRRLWVVFKNLRLLGTRGRVDLLDLHRCRGRCVQFRSGQNFDLLALGLLDPH